MLLDIFKLTGRIAIDGANQAKGEINDVADTAKGASSTMGGAFAKLGGIMATVFAIDKLKDFGVKIVQTAAEVQAETAQFESAFKEYAGSAEEMFGRVGDATGIFSTRLKVTGTKAYAQLKGAGLDANVALEQTEAFLNLAADAAAYYDISLEDAETRIRSFMRGNVEAGDAIGLFTSESQRNSYAMETYGKKWINLTEAQKQMLMLNVAQDIYSQAGATGQAARESTNLANVTGNLKEVWRQFLAVVGQPVLEMVTPIILKLTEYVTILRDKGLELTAWIEENRETVDFWKDTILTTTVAIAGMWVAMKAGTIIMQVTSWIKGANAALVAYKLACAESGTVSLLLAKTLSAGQLIWGLLTGQVSLSTVATLIYTKAQWALNAAWAANPVGLVIAGIVALIAIIVLLVKNVDGFREFWIDAWEKMKSVFTKVVDFIKENWVTMLLFLVNPAAAFFKLLYDNCEGFRNFVNGVFEKIKSAFSVTIEWLKKNWLTLIIALINPAAALFKYLYENCEGFRNFVNNAINAVKGFFANLWQKLTEGFSNLKKWIVTNICQPLKNFYNNWVAPVFNKLIEMAKKVVEIIVAVFVGLFNLLKIKVIQPLINAAQNLWNKIVTIFGKVKTWLTNSVINPVVNAISNMFNKVKNYASSAWNNIKSVFGKVRSWVSSNVINPVKNAVSNMFNSVKNYTSSAWNNLKSTFGKVGSFFKSVFQQAYSAVTRIFNNIASYFSGIWRRISNTFKNLGTTVGNAISNAVKSGLNSVIRAVENTINKGVNLINSAIGVVNKLPGVNVGKLARISLPRLEKGGILEKGQVGLLEGNGAEAVVPLERNKKWVSAVAEDMEQAQGGYAIGEDIQRLIDLLATFFPQILERMEMNVVLDDGTLVGKITPKINVKLAQMQVMNVRGG